MRHLTTKKLILALFLVPMAIIMLQNLNPTKFQLLFWPFEPPLIYVIVGSMAFGFVAGWLVRAFSQKGHKDVQDSNV